jgi:hypothetical protein
MQNILREKNDVIRRYGIPSLLTKHMMAKRAELWLKSVATLSPNPRLLYLLWDEYENGIGGRKAARLFSREERGKVKDKFHRRKVVWDCVATLVRAGLTAHITINHIHHIYGENMTVTKIINRMRQDRRGAGIVNPANVAGLVNIS